MNWENVKYIDPYLGLIQKDQPLISVEKQLNLYKEWQRQDFPHLQKALFLQDPDTPLILVLGGADPVGSDPRAGANIFIFNPAKNAWSYFGVMPEPRNYHAAIFCRGCVYVTGGNNPFLELCQRLQATNTTFRLEIRSKKWTRMSDMKFHRALHSIAVIDDAIFVFGGRDERGGILPTVEKYNPEMDDWSVMRQMPEPCMGMGCTVCRGVVWLIGGISIPKEEPTNGFSILDKVICYNPVKNQYFQRPNLEEPRAFCSAVTIFKEVWVFGGLTQTGDMDVVSIDSVVYFHPTMNRWESRHQLKTPKHACASAKVNHRAFLFGGMTSVDNETLSEGNVYDREKDKITDVKGLPDPVTGAAAVGVPADVQAKDGTRKATQALIDAASRPAYKEPIVQPDLSQKSLSTSAPQLERRSLDDKKEKSATTIGSWFRGHVEREQVAKKKKSKKESKPVTKEELRMWGRSRIRTAQVDKGVWGKWGKVNIPCWPPPPLPSSSLILPSERSSKYDKLMHDIKKTSQGKDWRRHYISFRPENDPNLGIVMFVDSFFNKEKKLLGLHVVDFAPLYASNLKQVDELMHDSLPTIVALGGFDPKDPLNLNSGRAVLRYHPLKERWEYYGLMPVARNHHAAVLLDGVIYVTGGYDPCVRDGGEIVASKTTYALDLKSGRWERKSDMLSARAHHGAAVINSQIFCIGGRDNRGRIVASVEVYDPTCNTWKSNTALHEGRMAMATTVCQGVIWIMGGVQAKPEDPHELYVVPTVECLDPSFKQWTTKEPLRVSRAYASAVTLNDQVWIIGGCSTGHREKNFLESMYSLDVFNEETNEWKMQVRMINGRHCLTVVALETCLYMFGGMSSQEWAAVNRTELYLKDFDTFHLAAEFPVALTGIAAVGIPPYMPTYRSQSLSDMIRNRVGYPVPFISQLRTDYRNVKSESS